MDKINVMKNNEFEEFFGLINTTSARRFNAHQIKQYGYLRAAGESVTKQVWKKAYSKPTPPTQSSPAKPKKDYSALLATLKPQKSA